jgi:hypothetical protein
MNLFGFGKQKVVEPVKPTIDVITSLKNTDQLLYKRIRHNEQLIINGRLKAVELHKTGNKRGALLELKKCKMIESNLDSMYGMKTNLEKQILTISSMLNLQDVYSAMSIAESSIKHISTKVNVDSVSNIMDDIEEDRANISEVSDILSRPIGGDDFNDDDLLRELEDNTEKKSEGDILKLSVIAPVSIVLPVAPTHIPKIDESTEQQQLIELEKLMLSS